MLFISSRNIEMLCVRVCRLQKKLCITIFSLILKSIRLTRSLRMRIGNVIENLLIKIFNYKFIIISYRMFQVYLKILIMQYILSYSMFLTCIFLITITYMYIHMYIILFLDLIKTNMFRLF